MSRTRIDVADTEPRDFYKLLTSILVPRPIAWVSTLAADGTANLAPHSFFTCSCVDPPILQFTSVGRKDSLRNVEATREFVVSFSRAEDFERINATATNFPAEISEFEQVGIEPAPSRHVAPPRVASSPAAFECELHATQSFGNSTVVFGRVLAASVEESVMSDRGIAEIGRLDPIARLGRNQWAGLGEIREIDRIPFEEWPGHYDR